MAQLSTNSKEESRRKEDVFRMAQLHDFAKATGDEEWTNITEKLLHAYLIEYRRFLVGGPEPSEPMSAWTPFQRTIRYASRYAEAHVESMNTTDAAKAIRMDMREEGRASQHVGRQALPQGIAEWIVRQATKTTNEQVE